MTRVKSSYITLKNKSYVISPSWRIDSKTTLRTYRVMSRLTLLGTVHRDPRGVTRLVEELERITPHVIALEFSIHGLRYRLKKKRSLNTRLLRGLYEIRGTNDLRLRELKELLRSTGIGGIRALLDLPYEYKGASFYSQRRGIPLYCLDISSYSRQLLRLVDELLSMENLKKVITFEAAPLLETVTREYRRAEDIVLNEKTSPWLLPIPADEVWEKRERILASRIRKIVARYSERPIVYIGGWLHLVARQGTLFNLLEDLKPKRVLLGRLYP